MWNSRESEKQHHGVSSPWMQEETGDCGYRALAAAFTSRPGESPEKAKAGAVKHAASLRARAATSIKKKGAQRESFAIDDKWTEQIGGRTNLPDVRGVG